MTNVAENVFLFQDDTPVKLITDMDPNIGVIDQLQKSNEDLKEKRNEQNVRFGKLYTM